MKGRTGAIRQKAIDHATLAAMENHGKRQDASGQSRRVRDEPPLVYGTLDLREAREAHLEGVVRQAGSRSACLHAVVQFPTGLVPADNPKAQEWMLQEAVGFMDDFHGGGAVFAARLDRDEAGRHTVDVFLMPTYDRTTKDGRTERRASVSRFSKQAAKARFGTDDRRAQGSALQAAWHEHLTATGRLKGLEPPTPKATTTRDRLEPEVYGLRQDEARVDVAKRGVKAANEVIQAQWAALDAGQRELEAGKRELEARAAAVAEDARAAAELASRATRTLLEADRRVSVADAALRASGRPQEAQQLREAVGVARRRRPDQESR